MFVLLMVYAVGGSMPVVCVHLYAVMRGVLFFVCLSILVVFSALFLYGTCIAVAETDTRL